MRGWPSSITRITEVRPAIAPILTMGRSQAIAGPTALTPTAMGSGTLSSVYLTMPVRTNATAMYSTVQIAREPRMPIGMSRCGFLASWAAVDTASNPMYAKKITPAPRTMPLQPYLPGPCSGGMNGVQFSLWM